MRRSPSQSFTQPPVRPGARPRSGPGRSEVQSTKLVSHGSDRFHVTPSRSQRTDRNRVSSMPARRSVPVRAAIGSPADQRLVRGRPGNAVLAGHLGDGPVAGRDRGGDLVPEPFSDPAPRTDRVGRLGERPPRTKNLGAHQAAFPPPQLDRLARRRQVPDPSQRPVLDRRRDHPQAGHGPSRAVCSTTTLTAAAAVRRTLRTRNSASRPNNVVAGSDNISVGSDNISDNTWGSTDVASVMLVASLLDFVRDQQHVGATSPPAATTRQSTRPANPR